MDIVTQESFEGMEGPPVITGPVHLTVQVTFTPGSDTYSSAWSIIDLENAAPVMWGESELEWNQAAAFAEGAMLIHRLREAHALLSPF